MKRARAQLIVTIAFLAVAGTIIAFNLSVTGRGRPGAPPGRGLLQGPPTRHRTVLPPVILWAWDRPEDLRFLPPKGIGVSFLAETVTLSGGAVEVKPRLHPLKVLPDTPLIACARIEADATLRPTLTTDQVSTAASAIAGLGRLPGVTAVQVDFDAARSQRAFYANLLRQLRRQLPAAMPVSITALTSWCTGDVWIDELPIDEAVPMLFRMGPDAADVRLLLAQGDDFSPAVCRESVGISTDEAIPALPSDRRRYIFRPEGWSQAAVQSLFTEEGQP